MRIYSKLFNLVAHLRLVEHRNPIREERVFYFKDEMQTYVERTIRLIENS